MGVAAERPSPELLVAAAHEDANGVGSGEYLSAANEHNTQHTQTHLVHARKKMDGDLSIACAFRTANPNRYKHDNRKKKKKARIKRTAHAPRDAL